MLFKQNNVEHFLPEFAQIGQKDYTEVTPDVEALHNASPRKSCVSLDHLVHISSMRMYPKN